jgi:hypothetical protein
MVGRLLGDARNWLNHASLRRAGFTVVLLGDGSAESPRPERNGAPRALVATA